MTQSASTLAIASLFLNEGARGGSDAPNSPRQLRRKNRKRLLSTKENPVTLANRERSDRDLLHSKVLPDSWAEIQVRKRVREEAYNLMKMVGRRESLESIRELIRVPHEDRERLDAFILANPVHSWWVLETLRFRTLVLEEFDQLATRPEYVERIARAEEDHRRHVAAEIPMVPLLQELVVSVSA